MSIRECYNIGGNNELNIELVRQICQLMDSYRPNNTPHNKLIEFVIDRKGHDWRYAIETVKLVKILIGNHKILI